MEPGAARGAKVGSCCRLEKARFMGPEEGNRPQTAPPARGFTTQWPKTARRQIDWPTVSLCKPVSPLQICLATDVQKLIRLFFLFLASAKQHTPQHQQEELDSRRKHSCLQKIPRNKMHSLELFHLIYI